MDQRYYQQGKRGGHGRGGGGHRGGNNRFDGSVKISGTDRFCTSCGSLIKAFAFHMLGKSKRQTFHLTGPNAIRSINVQTFH